MSKSTYIPSVNSPMVSIAGWVKTDRREGVNPRTQQPFNDPHMNCKLQLNTVKLASVIAAALAAGEVTVEVLGSLWTNEPQSANDPAITGNANTTRAEIEARRFAKAQETGQEMLAHLDNMPKPDEPAIREAVSG